MSEFIQKEIVLKAVSKGFHIITDQILLSLPELKNIEVGLLHILIKHTSASLTLNENADPSVRSDMKNYFDKAVPENEPYFRHDYEGADDMPAHIKSALTGCDLTIPVTNGKLNLGIWQGIYLCEHRNDGGARKVVLTLTGKLIRLK